MKLTVELTVSENITVVEVTELIAAIEDIRDADDCALVTVAGLVAVDDKPIGRLLSRTLKDFIKEEEK